MQEPESDAMRVAETWGFASGMSATPPPPEAKTCSCTEPLSARRLQTLAYELTVAEARERQRIAHVLHDDIGQLLAMAQLQLGELSEGASSDAAQHGALEDVRRLLCLAAQATRAATYELHSPVLHQLGLEAAVQSLAQRLQRGSKMQIHLQAELHDLPLLAEAMLSVLLRTVRELALNAQKHAQANNLWIVLASDAHGLRIRVADDGVGFDAVASTRRFSPEGGFGLLSAEAQMQAIGGQLAIDSAPGRGTIAAVTLGPKAMARNNPA
jgi:signal transduction histidine kinase